MEHVGSVVGFFTCTGHVMIILPVEDIGFEVLKDIVYFAF
jgi:hypothetical protein